MSQVIKVPMSVDLILATGSRAGITATIANGYYMIGRHGECQIRPKSRSVSRRHCVVHRIGETLKVLDLDSTAGTKINGNRIESRLWHVLHDGDELRCGKFCFRVAFQTTPQKSTATSPTASVVSAATSQADSGDAAGRMITGDAWQAFDIADFLESQDDADRQRRYEKIREWNTENLQDYEEIDSVDIEFEDESTNTVDRASATADLKPPRLDRPAPAPAPATTTSEPASKPQSAAARLTPETPFPTTSRRARVDWKTLLGGWFGSDGEKIKFIGAGLIALLILILVVWQALDFVSGPPVRLIEGLD